MKAESSTTNLLMLATDFVSVAANKVHVTNLSTVNVRLVYTQLLVQPQKNNMLTAC